MFYGTRILAAVQVAMLGYVIYRQRKMEKIMATVPAGLAAVTQAETDLAAGVTAETAADNQIITALQADQASIASLQAQVAGLSTEDPAVLAIANQLEALAKSAAANAAAVTATLAPAV